MIQTGTFLDLDMGTLTTGVRGFLTWWADELAGLLPERFRAGGATLSGKVLVWHGQSGFAAFSSDMAPAIGPGIPATILIDPALVLERHGALPAARLADLRRLVALDIDRLSPFAADDAFADVVTDGAVPVDGRVEAHMAFLPKSVARTLAGTIAAHDVRPTAIGMLATGGEARRFDFLPAMQADGLLPRGSSAGAWWWGAVALLFVMNLGLFVSSDVARVHRLQSLVDAQRPAASIARRLATGIDREDRARAALAARRRRDDPLATMALVARTLPAGAWIERLSIAGSAVRLSGYKQPQVDVMRPLRATGRLTGLRTATSDVAADSGTGQPFDISGERVTGR
ncbi:MAG: PilN domain-containing protein [Sphingomonas sp.]